MCKRTLNILLFLLASSFVSSNCDAMIKSFNAKSGVEEILSADILRNMNLSYGEFNKIIAYANAETGKKNERFVRCDGRKLNEIIGRKLFKPGNVYIMKDADLKIALQSTPQAVLQQNNDIRFIDSQRGYTKVGTKWIDRSHNKIQKDVLKNSHVDIYQSQYKKLPDGRWILAKHYEKELQKLNEQEQQVLLGKRQSKLNKEQDREINNKCFELMDNHIECGYVFSDVWNILINLKLSCNEQLLALQAFGTWLDERKSSGFKFLVKKDVTGWRRDYNYSINEWNLGAFGEYTLPFYNYEAGYKKGYKYILVQVIEELLKSINYSMDMNTISSEVDKYIQQ